MSRCSTTEQIDTQRKRMPRARVARRACVGRNTNSLRRKKAGACMRAKACGANSQGRTGFSCNWGAGPWLEPRPAYQQPRREEGLTCCVEQNTTVTPQPAAQKGRRRHEGESLRRKTARGARLLLQSGCGAVARARRALQLSSPMAMQGSLVSSLTACERNGRATVWDGREERKKREDK